MGNQYSKDLLRISEETLQLGQEIHEIDKRCPYCKKCLKEFWLRLEWAESQLQNLSALNEEYEFLQIRVERHLDFGEPLD